MKAFLCGGGDGEEIKDAYTRFNEVIDNSKPLLYIPLAMEEDKYDSCYEWITNELKDVSVPKIEMVRDSSEIITKDLNNYSSIFIGGGNTFKLLYDLKRTGAFEKIRDYLNNDGVVFGGSAGTIIFGENLNSCKLDDTNDVGLEDITGFNILNGISFLCHYTNRTKEKDEESKKYLLELSKNSKIIALPEEDTLYINNGDIEVIGEKPYYLFENKTITELNNKKKRV